MKILIIGGNGYIGSRLYKYLDEKFIIANVDNFWYGDLNHPRTLYVDYDNLSIGFLSEFTHIILLAGHSCPSACGTELRSCFENNVSNFVRLVEKLNDDQVLIYASTAAIYGNRLDLVNEDTVLEPPVDFYTYTKQAIETISCLYPNKNLIGLRFGTIAGISENFRQENLLNSLSVNSLMNKSITISNPNLMRSILGLNDCCRAVEQILQQGIKERRIYNLVSFTGSIIEIGRSIQKITGCDLTINNSMNTGYSFNCSSENFSKDYQFQFEDSIESLYKEITENLDKIKINKPRNFMKYG